MCSLRISISNLHLHLHLQSSIQSGRYCDNRGFTPYLRNLVCNVPKAGVGHGPHQLPARHSSIAILVEGGTARSCLTSSHLLRPPSSLLITYLYILQLHVTLLSPFNFHLSSKHCLVSPLPNCTCSNMFRYAARSPSSKICTELKFKMQPNFPF
jgi:hypothetical protein